MERLLQLTAPSPPPSPPLAAAVPARLAALKVTPARRRSLKLKGAVAKLGLFFDCTHIVLCDEERFHDSGGDEDFDPDWEELWLEVCMDVAQDVAQ